MSLGLINIISNNYGGRKSKTDMAFELAIFVKNFIEFVFKYYNINQTIYDEGRPPHNLINVISLLVYGNINGISSTIIISENAEYHDLYKLVSNRLFIADRTLRKYRSDYKELFNKILSLTLVLAYYLCFTTFDHIALDGTFLKAFNSPFNILKMEDIDILIKHFTIEKLSEEEILDLRLSAQNFLNSKNLKDDEKIEVLKTLKIILKESKQSSIGINDSLARWMYNKQHRPQLSYNVQHGVDVDSIMICGVNVSLSPTDHYEIPALMDVVLNNIPVEKPDMISADTIYRTIINLTYLKEKRITPLIPTRKQGKESINHLNKDPYSSDYFYYDVFKDVVICSKGHTLKKFGPYECKPDKFGYSREQYSFSNYKACQSCKDKEQCCKNSTHRTITRYGHDLLDECEQIMEITENKLEYRKRSLVELPNGPYKIYYHINELPLVGQENIQAMMELIASSYNIKRLFNTIKEKEINLDDVYKVMKILTEPTSNFLCNMGMLQNEQYST